MEWCQSLPAPRHRAAPPAGGAGSSEREDAMLGTAEGAC